MLQTVVELTEYLKQATTCMSDDSRTNFITFIAKNPLAGCLIPGTGGARKVRWQKEKGGGKRGGVRIIYYYHSQDLPLFLFTVYGKTQRENLSEKEKNVLKSIVKQLATAYGRK